MHRPHIPSSIYPPFDARIERHEAKYIVPYSFLPSIRTYLAPYVTRDPNGEGATPQYVVTTLQLDSADLVLCRASETEQLNRVKLRIRKYGHESGVPVFLEIKRKTGGVIHKTRTMIPAEDDHAELLKHPQTSTPCRDEHEEVNLLNFIRLVEELGARPVCMIQYLRESYTGNTEDYARITFDTNLRYQMTTEYAFEAVHPGGWRQMDTASGLQTNTPSFILELKSKTSIPFWMMDLVNAFDLQRVGFCKYSTAVRLNAALS